jgi:diacylglycerol kinase
MGVPATREQTVERPRRAEWRQRLVDAETGLRFGIRTDSTLFVHLFCTIIIVLTALVVGLSAVEWSVVVLALGMSFSAELFHQLLKQFTAEMEHHFSRSLEQRMRIGTTAAVAANVTALLVIGILFWNRLHGLWTG